MSTISVVCRRDKKDKKGTVPLYLRTTVKDKVRYASLKLRIGERHWNDNAEIVRKTHPDHASLNRYLLEKKGRGSVGVV